MSQKIDAKQLIEQLAKEIGRLQKLCRDNNIDPTPPPPKSGGHASISVTPKITVFNSKEEAEAALKKSKL